MCISKFLHVFISFLFVCLTFSSIAAPGPGGSLFVTVDGGGDCQQSTPCTLTEAFAAAVDLDEIYLAAGAYSGAT
ncbi:hypothetical protein, partial [Thiolapillus sp.]